MRVGFYVKNMLSRHETGIGKYVTSLIRAYVKEFRDEVHVFTTSQRSVAEFNEGVEFHHIPHLYGMASISYDLGKMAEMASKMGIDVVHAPKSILITGGKVPGVITIHDMYHIKAPKAFRSLVRAYWHRYMPRSINDAGAIIVPSKSTLEDLINYAPEGREKAHVVRHGVESYYFTTPTSSRVEAVRERYNMPEDYILCVSGINPRKNIGTLIKAYNIFKHRFPKAPPLVLVGRYEWGPRDVLAQMERAKDITHLTYVKEKDLPVLYHLSRYFVYPSVYEGFGLPLLEAMAAGRAVIASKISSMPEVCGNSAVYVDAPTAPEAWSKAMAELEGDEGLRNRLGERGVRAAKEMTWERCAQGTRSAFLRALDRV